MQMLHLFAAGLRQFAHEIMDALPPPVPPRRRAGGDDDDAPPLQPALSAAQGHPEAAKALRVAAGVYTYLETNLADLAAAGSRRSALDCVR